MLNQPVRLRSNHEPAIDFGGPISNWMAWLNIFIWQMRPIHTVTVHTWIANSYTCKLVNMFMFFILVVFSHVLHNFPLPAQLDVPPPTSLDSASMGKASTFLLTLQSGCWLPSDGPEAWTLRPRDPPGSPTAGRGPRIIQVAQAPSQRWSSCSLHFWTWLEEIHHVFLFTINPSVGHGQSSW